MMRYQKMASTSISRWSLVTISPVFMIHVETLRGEKTGVQVSSGLRWTHSEGGFKKGDVEYCRFLASEAPTWGFWARDSESYHPRPHRPSQSLMLSGRWIANGSKWIGRRQDYALASCRRGVICHRPRQLVLFFGESMGIHGNQWESNCAGVDFVDIQALDSSSCSGWSCPLFLVPGKHRSDPECDAIGFWRILGPLASRQEWGHACDCSGITCSRGTTKQIWGVGQWDMAEEMELRPTNGVTNSLSAHSGAQVVSEMTFNSFLIWKLWDLVPCNLLFLAGRASRARILDPLKSVSARGVISNLGAAWHMWNTCRNSVVIQTSV